MKIFETLGTALTEQVRALRRRAIAWGLRAKRTAAGLLAEQSGQGTTEYAILVGVLVVIAIIAIVAFRDKVQELWDDIVDGFEQL